MEDREILRKIRTNLLSNLSEVSDIKKIIDTLFCVREINAVLTEFS